MANSQIEKIEEIFSEAEEKLTKAYQSLCDQEGKRILKLMKTLRSVNEDIQFNLNLHTEKLTSADFSPIVWKATINEHAIVDTTDIALLYALLKEETGFDCQTNKVVDVSVKEIYEIIQDFEHLKAPSDECHLNVNLVDGLDIRILVSLF